jgi:colanic acid/amylovoran biosynthesis protein
MRKVVITNVFGPLNRGDHELFKVLIETLKKYNLSISAIARDPELCSEYFPDIKFYEQLGKCTQGKPLQQIFTRIAYLALCILVPFAKPLKRFLPSSQRNAINALSEADLVISCPGGFLEDSSPSLYSHLVQLLVAVFFNRTLVLAPMSIGPIKSLLPRETLKFILKKSDEIFVREPVSKKFCKDLGISSRISNDLAFVNTLSSFDKNSGKSKFNCISATVIDWNFPEAEDPISARDEYVTSIAKVLNDLHDFTGLPVNLIIQVESDLPTIERVKSKLYAPCEVMHGIDTPEKIKDLLMSSFCLVASRFHSAVFSLSVACPVIALAYLPKTIGMLDLYNLSDLHRPIDNFDPVEVALSLKSMGFGRQEFIERMEATLLSIQQVGNPFLLYLHNKFQDNVMTSKSIEVSID